MDWPTAKPENVGINSHYFRTLHGEIERHPEWNVHAVLIAKDGKLVYENYYEGADQKFGRSLGHVKFSSKTLHDCRSVSKSVTSTLVGIAQGQGLIQGVNTNICDLFPQAPTQPAHSQISLEHLLTMSSGIDWDETGGDYTNPHNDEIGMILSSNEVEFVLTKNIVSKPGERFNYCGGSTALLGELVEQRSGKKLDEYAEEVLFKPLNIESFKWMRTKNNKCAAWSGLRLLPRDLLKYGQLYLDKGKWGGHQIVPSSWVEASLNPVSRPEYPGGYGYQWWIAHFEATGQSFKIPYCNGNGGQRVYLVVELGLVIVILCGNYDQGAIQEVVPRRILTRFVFPAAGVHEARCRL